MTNGYEFCMRKVLKCQNLEDIKNCRSLVNKMATCNLLLPNEFLNLQLFLAKNEKALDNNPKK